MEFIGDSKITRLKKKARSAAEGITQKARGKITKEIRYRKAAKQAEKQAYRVEEIKQRIKRGRERAQAKYEQEAPAPQKPIYGGLGQSSMRAATPGSGLAKITGFKKRG